MPTITYKHNNDVLEYIETPKTHYHKLNGVRVVGASTLAKCYPTSRRLIDWEIKQGAAATYDAMIEAFKTKGSWPNKEEKKALIDNAVLSSTRKKDSAANIGTLVHEYIYHLEMGKDMAQVKEQVEAHPDSDLVKNCIKAFESRPSFTLVSAEQSVASVKYNFAGRYDGIYKVNGKLRLVDYKTSSSIYVEQFIQLAAYAIAVEEWEDKVIDEIEVIRLGKDGKIETHVISSYKPYRKQAIRCVETYYFDKMATKELEAR